MDFLVKIVREPLVHFMLIGVLVFLAFARLNEPVPGTASQKQVELTLSDIGQLVTQFEKTWRRMPTRAELDGLIETRVREEILVKEALSLSMDKGDAVIERRLSQKMAFLMESAAGAIAPADDELIAYFEENQAKYASAPLIAFEQVFLGEAPSQAEVSQAMAALAGGQVPASIGRQTLLPPVVPLASAAAVDGVFGRGFFDAVSELDAGKWAAPVLSAFGVHAVRVSENAPSAIPGFEAVRERVAADYRASAAEELSNAMYAEMRAGYAVKLPHASELESVLQ